MRTQAEKSNIYREYCAGALQTDLAYSYGTSPSRIGQILKECRQLATGELQAGFKLLKPKEINMSTSHTKTIIPHFDGFRSVSTVSICCTFDALMFKNTVGNRKTMGPDGTPINKKLYASMLRYGNQPAYPIVVKPVDAAGEYEIIDGHNRLAVAVYLDEPIYFVIDPSGIEADQCNRTRKEYGTKDWENAYEKLANVNPDEAYSGHYRALSMMKETVKSILGVETEPTWVMAASKLKVTGKKPNNKEHAFETSPEAMLRVIRVATVLSYLVGKNAPAADVRLSNPELAGFITKTKPLEVLSLLLSDPDIDANIVGQALANNAANIIKKCTGTRRDVLSMLVPLFNIKGTKKLFDEHEIEQKALAVVRDELGKECSNWWKR